MFDDQFMLVADCSACFVKVKGSNIQHDSSRCGVLSGRPFSAGEIVGYYYAKIVYTNLKTQVQV